MTLQKIFQGQPKGFLGCKGHTWAETIEKLKKDYQVSSHEGSTFFKKGPHFGENSRPGESDPYVGVCKIRTGQKWPILHNSNYHLSAMMPAICRPS